MALGWASPANTSHGNAQGYKEAEVLNGISIDETLVTAWRIIIFRTPKYVFIGQAVLKL